MLKSVGRRQAIIDLLADHVLAHGLSASSLRPLAQAARISDRMLLYYFKDKAEVIAAALECISARLASLMSQHTGKKPLPLETLMKEISNLLFSDELWPYMRVWLEIAALAARADGFYRAVGETIARDFLAWGASQLACDTATQRKTDAAKLLVSIEGMVLLKSVGLDDECKKALHM